MLNPNKFIKEHHEANKAASLRLALEMPTDRTLSQCLVSVCWAGYLGFKVKLFKIWHNTSAKDKTQTLGI